MCIFSHANSFVFIARVQCVCVCVSAFGFFFLICAWMVQNLLLLFTYIVVTCSDLCFRLTSLTLLVCLFSICSAFFCHIRRLMNFVAFGQTFRNNCNFLSAQCSAVPTWGEHRQNFSEVGGKKVLYDIIGVPSMSDDATLSVLR